MGRPRGSSLIFRTACPAPLKFQTATAIALLVVGEHGSLVVRNTTFDLVATPGTSSADPGALRRDGHGIFFAAPTQIPDASMAACGPTDAAGTTNTCCYPNPQLNVALADVVIRSEGASLGIGLGGDLCPKIASLAGDNLLIAGFASAVGLLPDAVRLNDIDVQCVASGISLDARPHARAPWTLANVKVHGCSATALSLSAQQATITNLEIVDASVGFEDLVVDLDLSNFTIADTDVAVAGAMGNERGNATLRDGLVVNATLAGIRMGHLQFSVNRVVFRGNGAGWSSPAIMADDPTIFGGLVFRSQWPTGPQATPVPMNTVHECSFEDNQPFGLMALSPVDAANNWWGSTDGPAVVIHDARGIVPDLSVGGHGDNVTAHVRFLPFLTDPPA